MACVTNHYAASDGDFFTYFFKKYKLGPVIGEPAWGGEWNCDVRHSGLRALHVSIILIGALPWLSYTPQVVVCWLTLVESGPRQSFFGSCPVASTTSAKRSLPRQRAPGEENHHGK
jgi:hypothetical protein